jgi:ATP-dependent helicase/nuclease subunit B
LTADGSEPALSDIFRYVRLIFAAPNGDTLPVQKGMAEEWLPYQCAKAGLAVRQMLLKKNEFERKLGESKFQAEYSSIYDALQKMECEQGGDYWLDTKEQDSVSRGEQLFFHDGKISPTKLETYFSCPFKNFAQNGLRLKEREERAVLSLDTGNFIHTVLERTAGQIKEGGIKDDKQAYEYAQTVGKELLSSPLYAAQADEANHAVFTRNLLDEAASAAVAVYRQIAHSSYQIEKLENKIDGDIFSGKVDRVDVAPAEQMNGQDRHFVRVIDYKSGSIETSVSSYYVGKKLQLQLYMSSLKGERVPAGVFYFPASVNFGEEEGRFRMHGFVNGNAEALRAGDINIEEGKFSEYFPAGIDKTSKWVLEETAFRNFLDYSIFVARQGAKELKEGYIAPTPYEGACTYCKYGGMCGFNPDSCSQRAENTVSAKQIAEIARVTREGKEENNE